MTPPADPSLPQLPLRSLLRAPSILSALYELMILAWPSHQHHQTPRLLSNRIHI